MNKKLPEDKLFTHFLEQDFITHHDLIAYLHMVMYHPNRVIPTIGYESERVLRVRLIAEELKEFAQAAGVSLDLDMDSIKSIPEATPNIYQMADAITDIDVVTTGAYCIFGLPSRELQFEVFQSNCSKLNENNEPIYDEHGKFQKGPNYRPPNIKGILDKHKIENPQQIETEED